MIDRRTIEFCYKCLDTVVRFCDQSRLNLNNNPPYILNIIPDIYEKLHAIISNLGDDCSTLPQVEYLEIYLLTLIDRCQHTIKLFKETKEEIFHMNSRARIRLTKLSLVFSHLLKDLEAVFPHNNFMVSDFRITKPDAARWWSTNFGSRIIVAWDTFQTTLLRTFSVDFGVYLQALQTTIDLTRNHHVSIFEFDVFTRLFQPWNNILQTWKTLALLHPGYKAFMTYDEVKQTLQQYCEYPGPGSYVFRLSCTKLGQWAVGYITQDLQIVQTIVKNKSLVQALIDGEKGGFYLYPNGKSNPSSLLYHLMDNVSQIRMQVTKEQYEDYCEIGSTFQICKICDENDKNIQLQPCGHLICKPCLISCQSPTNGLSCPFCRMKVKGTEEVVIDPYIAPVEDESELQKNVDAEDLSMKEAQCLVDRSPSVNGSVSVKSCDLVFSGCEPPPVPPRNSYNLLVSHDDHIPQLNGAVVITSTTTNTPTNITVKSDTTNLFTIQSGSLLIENQSKHDQSDPPNKPGEPSLNYTELGLNDSVSPNDILSSDSDPTVRNLNQESDQLVSISHSVSNSMNEPNISLSHPAYFSDYKYCDKLFNAREEATLTDLSEKQILVNSETTTTNSNNDNNNNNSECANEDNCDADDNNGQFNENVKQLLDWNRDMTEEIAKTLLNITQNHLHMSNNVWKYFMPRENTFHRNA